MEVLRNTMHASTKAVTLYVMVLFTAIKIDDSIGIKQVKYPLWM